MRRIAQTGTPRELYEEPANLFVADFIGDANIVEATLQETRGETAIVMLDVLALELPRRGVSGRSVKLAVRPDAISLSEKPTKEPAMAGRVGKASYLGTHVEYEVETPVGTLFVVDHGRKDPYLPGTAVAVTLSPERGVAIIPEA